MYGGEKKRNKSRKARPPCSVIVGKGKSENPSDSGSLIRQPETSEFARLRRIQVLCLATERAHPQEKEFVRKRIEGTE